MKQDFARSGQYSPLLEQLIGRWNVAMTTTTEHSEPTRATGLVAVKSWFADGRYVREDIQGMFGGGKHEKLTLLGFNATRHRYEYMTADNHDGVILLYVSSPGDRSDQATLTLFTEYAMPGEEAGSAATLCYDPHHDHRGQSRSAYSSQ